jgi:hypothetical protein
MLDTPTARLNFSAATVNGTTYAIGGATMDALIGGSWNFPMAPKAPPVSLSGGAAGLGTMLYAVGNGNTIYSYNTTNDTWAQTTVTSGQTTYAATALAGRIYTVDNSGVIASWAPGETAWTIGPKQGTPRDNGCVAAGIDGRIYYVGGGGSANGYKVEAYAPGAKTWVQAANLNSNRTWSACAGAPDGRIYVPGAGKDDTEYNNNQDVEAYTPKLNRWVVIAAQLAATPTPARQGMAVTIGADGRVYAMGGYNGQILQRVEAYGPTAFIQPQSGTKGNTKVTVESGFNFAANATVRVWLGSTKAPPIVTGTTTATGQFTSSMTFTVPATVPLGPNTVTVADNKSAYPITFTFVAQ